MTGVLIDVSNFLSIMNFVLYILLEHVEHCDESSHDDSNKYKEVSKIRNGS